MASQPSLSDLRRAKFARRLPAALSELAGPEHGTVSLPLHLAWSGLTTFDLDQPRLRMSYYRIGGGGGPPGAFVRGVNGGRGGPVLAPPRARVSRGVRVWW
ncbi:transcriptional regulator, partial [Streptomyces sp. NPDC059814]|uniref:transcriptional regulator n=1 Tax=Streptomyces sp. NPDC059814 TaxID=3346959 RepID=UPI003667F440